MEVDVNKSSWGRKKWMPAMYAGMSPAEFQASRGGVEPLDDDHNEPPPPMWYDSPAETKRKRSTKYTSR